MIDEINEVNSRLLPQVRTALGIHLQERRIRDLELRKAPQEGRIMLRVSSIGNCTRRLAYDVFRQMALEGQEGVPEDLREKLKFEPEWSSHNLFTVNLGNSIHDMIQRWLMDMRWLRCRPYLDEDGLLQWMGDAEIELKDNDLRILGHCDGITVPLIEAPQGMFPCPECWEKEESICGICGRYLIEIKSITDRPRTLVKDFGNIAKWEKVPYGTTLPLTGGGLIGTFPGKFTKLVEPEPEHVAQAQMYAHLVKKHLGIDLRGILFLYIAKDTDPDEYEDESPFNIPVKALLTPINPLLQEQIVSKIRSVWDCVERGALPARDWYWDGGESKPYECYYRCEFANLCYPGIK